PRHRERTRRDRPGRADHLPPQPRDGQRLDAGAGRRSRDPARLLRGLAERVLRAARRQRGDGEAASMKTMNRISRRRALVDVGAAIAAIAGIQAAAGQTQTSQPRSGNMEIKRSGSQPSRKGPAEWFTGSVRVDPLFQPPEPARVSGGHVTFEPGARTAWHTHPLGQTLLITSGLGWVQREGGPIEEVRPGDVVWFPPGEKHWHGAAPTTAMTHIAM